MAMKDATCCDPCGATALAGALNSDCFCGGLDLASLGAALQSSPDTPDIAGLIAERCPHLFSPTPVFISHAQARRMEELIAAVNAVAALPSWRAALLDGAGATARHDPGAHGVFFGYDFHVDGDEIGLIEINTNAGGALLNAALAPAQTACAGLAAHCGASSAADFERDVIDMFRNEFRLGGHTAPLGTVAIVDTDPQAQYLYPEFLLFQRLFERHGIKAVIADPSALRWEDQRLWHGSLAIDLVYNRLTDFTLESAPCTALRAALLADAAVVTPHPQAHALYADKRNLALLTDPARLEALGVPQATRRILLAGIPHTEVVQPADADVLWARRKSLFFKPTSGYGGRAAYRGDKLTTRVWQEILAGDYVAQALMAPGERMTGSRAAPDKKKFDIRCYCYDGKVQWTAARLYQGQTTNFRTPGGGFAVVYRV
jgi:hypothetical protein